MCREGVAVGVAVGKAGVISSCAVICSYFTDIWVLDPFRTWYNFSASPVRLPWLGGRLLL